MKLFYHDNSNFLLFPESERHVEIIGDRFPVDCEKFQLVAKYLHRFLVVTGGTGNTSILLNEKKETSLPRNFGGRLLVSFGLVYLKTFLLMQRNERVG